MDTLCIAASCITHAETRSIKAPHTYCERQYNGCSLKSTDAYIHAHNDIHIIRNEFCTWDYGYEAVCSFMCVFFRAAVSIVLVAKGNSRLELCWLPTRLTLTPKVNTLYKCVRGFIGFIATYVTDWWPQWHMWWAPCIHITLCVHVCVSGGI